MTGDRPVDPEIAGLAPALQPFARMLEGLLWSALLLDGDWRLVWTSSELRAFLDVPPDADLGYGRHVVEVFFHDAWARTVHPDSAAEMFAEIGPFLAMDLQRRGAQPAAVASGPFLDMLRAAQPLEIPLVWSTSFGYVSPRGDREVADYRVNTLFVRLFDPAGTELGILVLFFMGVRPNLLALLGRGHQDMYERMARLVEPGRREAAILFCDLHGSGVLSRRLASESYFRLIRELWMAIDETVARHTGIVGKHAGDGATAFFLVEDLGGASEAARAAVLTARRIHELSAEVFAGVEGHDCLMKVGVHWGASLYMGQLVPGGRLDVTALGDEVNEAARIQEAAGADETLASKQLIERLTAEDAAAVGIDPARVTYRMLAEIAAGAEKVVRDAGSIAVTPL